MMSLAKLRRRRMEDDRRDYSGFRRFIRYDKIALPMQPVPVMEGQRYPG